MNRNRSLVWMLVAAAGLAVPLSAQGQESQPARSKPQPSSEVQRQGADAQSADASRQPAAPRIDVEFGGGTVRDYIRTLREASKPDRVNVVAPEGLLNARLGELSLQNVTVETAVRALEWAMGLRAITVGQIGPNAYGLNDRNQRSTSAQASSDESAEVQVMSLRDIIEPLPGDPQGVELTVPAEIVLTAIQAAVEATNSPVEADLKFHGDSGLLIMRGTRRQLEAAGSVLGQIGSGIVRRRTAAKQIEAAKIDLAALRAETDKQRARVGYIERAFVEAARALEHSEELLKAGSLSADAVASARARMDKARADLDLAKIDENMASVALEAGVRRAAEAHGKVSKSTIPQERSTLVYEIGEVDDKERAKIIEAIDGFGKAVGGQATATYAGGRLTVNGNRTVHELTSTLLRAMASARGSAFKEPSVQNSIDGAPSPTR